MNNIPEITPYDASSVTRNSKCKCTKRCTEFYRVNGFDVYCKGTLEQLALNILNVTKGKDFMRGSYNNRGWTVAQEQKLIDYIEKNGVRYGTYRLIGELIGKDRKAVRAKVEHLEKQGRLKRK